jgi:TRAP transporter TAXI family solute receptor
MSALSQQKEKPTPLRFATGARKGLYYEIGKLADSLAHEAKTDSSLRDKLGQYREINPIETQGSLENLELLRDKKVNFALAQLDVIIKQSATMPDTDLTLVCPLYVEYIHIIVNRSLQLKDLRGLVGKRVFWGFPSSGTAITSASLLGLMEVSPAEFRDAGIDSLRDLARKFNKDSVDAAMYMGAKRNSFIRQLLESTKCELFSLDPATVRAIELDVKSQNRGVRGTSVFEEETYPSQRNKINTIAVQMMLVTTDGVQDKDVEYMRQLIMLATAILAERPDSPDLSVPKEIALPEEPVLKAFRDYKYIQRPTAVGIDTWIVVALVTGSAFLMWQVLMHLGSVARYLRRRPITIILVAAVAICLSGAVMVYYFEHTVNRHFETFYETCWSVAVYVTSGLEDRAPITPLGRLTASMMLVTGPVFLALLAGYFASSILKQRLERSMTQNLKNHLLILNWNPRVPEVVRQVHSPDLGSEAIKVVVIMSDDTALNLKELESRFKADQGQDAFEDVYICPGDPCDERSLLNANAQDSKAILIMSDLRQGQAADEKTFRTIIAIQHVADRKKMRPHVVAEISKFENSFVVRNLAKTFPGTLSAVSEGELRTLLLAQATIIPGLVDFYTDLLTFSDDTNEVYKVAIPGSAVGMSFPDYSAKVLEHRSSQQLLPVGIYRSENGATRLLTNPQPYIRDGMENPDCRLRQGDELLVLALRAPSRDDLPG